MNDVDSCCLIFMKQVLLAIFHLLSGYADCLLNTELCTVNPDATEVSHIVSCLGMSLSYAMMILCI